jgi:hypothetical protein
MRREDILKALQLQPIIARWLWSGGLVAGLLIGLIREYAAATFCVR